jgi:hypothetical protein
MSDCGKGVFFRGTIVHLCGTACSGKSSLIAREAPHVPSFDMAEFYRRHGVLSSDRGSCDVDAMRSALGLHLVPELREFFEENKMSPAAVVESGGTGRHVNAALNSPGCVVARRVETVVISAPSAEEVRRRAEARGSDPDSAERFLRYWVFNSGPLWRMAEGFEDAATRLRRILEEAFERGAED